MPVPDVKKKTIHNKLADNVVIGSNLMTDEWLSYRGLNWLFNHKFIKHNVGQYVKDNIHTNTIENYWSLLKRGIKGIYHFISAKHIQKYLNEFCFRYNTIKYSESDRFDYFLSNYIESKNLTYKRLIAK